MSRAQVPISVKRLRSKPKTYLTETAAYEYLLSILRRHVISEKYILDKKILVLDALSPDKRMVKMAIEAIFKAEVIKVTSLVRKPYVKNFRGQKGMTSKYSRVYIRTKEPVDLKLLEVQGGKK